MTELLTKMAIKPSTAANLLEMDKRVFLRLFVQSGKIKAKRLSNKDIRIDYQSFREFFKNLPDAYNNEETIIKKQVDKLIQDGIL